MARFVKESRIAASPERVFAFHESPGALERLTPPWERVKVVSGGESLRPGTRVLLRTQVGPVSIDWIAEQTEYEPGSLFADRQIRGPFRSWYHRHIMLDDGHGGTILRDDIEYEPPFGAIGRFLGSRWIRRKLERLFEYRHEETRRIVESNAFSVSTASPSTETLPSSSPRAPKTESGECY
jgi:ligand-binding SRPBCC domain-containing protein